MFMPAPGSPSAPVFDPTEPRELPRYFDTLEFLLSQANITNDLEKIKAAIQYVDLDVSYLWRSAATFSASPADYEAFKREIISLYPDADISNTYTLGQLLSIVSQTRESSIHSVSDVSAYHCQFTSIASVLKSQGRLSELEMNREFVRVFQDVLWQRISARLQLIYTDHHPDDPWPVSDVQKATCFVLRGTSSISSAPSNVPAPHSFAQSRSPPLSSLGAFPVKSEPDHVAQLTSLVMETVKATHALLETFQGIAECSAASLPPSSPPKTCNFCGRGHFIRDCDSVDTSRQARRLRCDHGGIG